MAKPSSRLQRLLVGTALVTLLGGCYLDQGAPPLPHCGNVGRPESESLEEVAVGRWIQYLGSSLDSAAPMFGLVEEQDEGQVQWEFRADHTGDLWWWDSGGIDHAPASGGTETFTWRAEDDLLYVNNLPPAVVLMGPARESPGVGVIRVRTPDEREGTGTLLYPCEL